MGSTNLKSFRSSLQAHLLWVTLYLNFGAMPLIGVYWLEIYIIKLFVGKYKGWLKKPVWTKIINFCLLTTLIIFDIWLQINRMLAALALISTFTGVIKIFRFWSIGIYVNINLMKPKLKTLNYGMRLQRRLYEVCIVCFLIFMILCNFKLLSFCTQVIK